MAETLTLARPYARAAFEYAREQEDLLRWSEALRLGAAVALDPKVAALLVSPALTAEQKSLAFIEIGGDNFNPALQNFFRVLAEQKRLPLMGEISRLFELYKANEEKTIDVDLRSAFAIDAEYAKTLTQSLSDKLKRKVELHTTVDPTLIGGALIRAGDTVIDGSIRGRLAKLGEAMGV